MNSQICSPSALPVPLGLHCPLLSAAAAAGALAAPAPAGAVAACATSISLPARSPTSKLLPFPRLEPQCLIR